MQGIFQPLSMLCYLPISYEVSSSSKVVQITCIFISVPYDAPTRNRHPYTRLQWKLWTRSPCWKISWASFNAQPPFSNFSLEVLRLILINAQSRKPAREGAGMAERLPQRTSLLPPYQTRGCKTTSQPWRQPSEDNIGHVIPSFATDATIVPD